jgi:type III secretion system YscQ/HrcQ family protein
VRRVRPFPFDRLPRVARNQVEAGRTFRAHLPLAAGGSLAELERGLGGPLRFRLLECFVARARDLEALLAGVVVRLVGPGERFCLVVVDRAIAVALAGRALGIDRAATPELAAPRAPTLAEAGVIELLVQLLVEAQPVQVVGVVEPEELLGLLGTLADDALVHVLSARVESAAGAGAAYLVVPQALSLAAPPVRARVAALRRRGRLESVRVELGLELARVTVPRSLLADLRVGDVLAFDAPAPVRDGPVPVALRFGRGALRANADARGLTLTHAFAPYEGAVPMSSDAPRPADDADHLLRELPVEIVCELGRVSMSGRELLELEPGAVVPIARPLAGPIDLTVGGRVVARGELVDVEGDLGVRVTEIVE